MAPEFAPSVVIFDALDHQADNLQGRVEYVEAPSPTLRLRIRWNAERQPDGYLPIGNGVAYVYAKSNPILVPVSDDAKATPVGANRFQWTEGLQFGQSWLMFIAILPPATTLVDPEPRPVGAKCFGERLALYWMLKGDEFERTKVEFTLKAYHGDAEAACLHLNRTYLSSQPVAPTTVLVEPTTQTILFLAADPTDSARLRLAYELRQIQEKLQLARRRDAFRLETRLAVRPADVSQALLDLQPQIVHFAGHGLEGGLFFENEAGAAHVAPTEALAALFALVANTVACVLLNACYSESQAKAIAQHIPYVIGMNNAVDDQTATAFAVGFYQALGAGKSIVEAYHFGCVQIQLLGLSPTVMPVLFNNRSHY